MTQEEIAKKNLDLHAEFMRYAFDHPEVLDRIPRGATLVILPEDNEELYSENLKVVEEKKGLGPPVVVIKMKTPEPIVPTLEVVNAN